MTPVAEVLVVIGGSPAASLVVKASAIIVLALAGVWLARATRAAVRHALLASAFAALLVLPAASIFMSPVTLPVPVTAAPLVSKTPAPLVQTADRAMAERASVVGDTRPSTTHHHSAPAFDRLLAAWAAGMLLVLVPLALGLYRTWTLRRRGRPWHRGEVMVAQLAMKAGRRRIDVLLHESIPAPMTCGVMRPAILLPLDAPAWPGDELRRAMVHELQHIRRGDWLTQCVAHGVCALYWFHPLVWMAKGRLALEAERACDDVVLQESEATSYADQLVTLAQRLSMAASRPMVGMATTTHFATRIRAVLNPAQRRGYVGAGWVTVAVVSAVVVVAAVAPIRAVAAAPRAERVMNELLSVESTAVHREAVETRAVRDSRPQPSAPPIPAVERPRRESAIASSQAAAANPLAAREPVLRAQDGAVSSQSNTRRMSVLLFDVTSLSPEDLQQIAAQATRLVDLTKGPDMAAVVSVGSRLQVIADFTNDREALINAIQSLSVSQDKPAVVQVTPPASESLVTSLGSVAPASLSALSNDHLRAVATLCQVLAPMRDRKGIVFFNAGIPDDNVPEAELRSATNVCSRANVAVYPVDARGFSVGVRF